MAAEHFAMIKINIGFDENSTIFDKQTQITTISSAASAFDGNT